MQNSTEIAHLWFPEWQSTLAGKSEGKWAFHVTVDGLWQLFANNHWVWMDATPINTGGRVEIVTQWSEMTGPNNVRRWVHFRNRWETPVVFQVRVAVAPNI
jgi:hypothetical protein